MATPTTPATDLPLRQQTSSFDIVATYHNLLAADPDLTKPVAAIESLIALLNTTSSTTAHETLETVKLHSNRLKASVVNPVPLSAGTDIFLQYLVSSLKQEEPAAGFDAVRQHLLRNGRLFAERAVAARNGVAEAGWRFITQGSSILTHGASRSVTNLLNLAVDKMGAGSFRVIYVRDETRAAENDRVVKELRAKGIPVAEIPSSGVAHVMGLLRRVQMVFIGAEAVTQNGGIISRLGTFQIAQLALQFKKPVYVTAETHKFARKFPLDQRDIGFKQEVLDFSVDAASVQPSDAVDYTPPDLITNLITEKGVKRPVYVFEQLLDIYGSLSDSNERHLSAI
jgi:translation initiation factor eIF-2B subunit alpha